MPAPDPPSQLPAVRSPTVFLSYASEDRPAAQALRDALHLLGVEVWYDEAELMGGEAWDQKLRRQIRECDFFMAVISAQTQARHEGYFRREWRLAAERSLDMSDDHLFLLPVVIDDTPQAGARVPEKFLSVQWTQVPGGQPNTALEALCRRLLAGKTAWVPPRAPAVAAEAAARGPTVTMSVHLPPFPQRQPGQNKRYALEVLGWYARSGWRLYRGLPRPWQVAIASFIFFTVIVPPLASLNDDNDEPQQSQAEASAKPHHNSAPDQVASAAIDQQVRRLVENAQSAAGLSPGVPLLAIPFSASAGDADARKLAENAFAQVYGRLALSHHGLASHLLDKSLPSADDASALERAREEHASYVLFGSVAGAGDGLRLTVRMLKASDGSQAWSQSYPATDIDAAAIATEVAAHLHEQE